MSRYVSLAVLVGVVLLFGLMFYQVMAIFLPPLFVAALLGVIFRPAHAWLLARLHNRQVLAALAATLLAAVVVLGPAVLVLTLATLEGVSLARLATPEEFNRQLGGVRDKFGLAMPQAEHLREIEHVLEGMQRQNYTAPQAHQTDLEHVMARARRLEAELTPPQARRGDLTRFHAALEKLRGTPAGTVKFGDEVTVALAEFQSFKATLFGNPAIAWLTETTNPTPAELAHWKAWATTKARDTLPAFTGAAAGWTGRLLLGVAITFTALYFLFAEGERLTNGLMRHVPMDIHHQRELLGEFERVCRAVALALVLAALAQGFTACVGYFFVGVESVFLLTLLTTVCALVPFIGAAGVWIPVALWITFVEQRYVAGGLFALYGVTVISLIDNIIKPLVLHGQSNLHPLLALLSILGGITALGPIGIVLGPMIVVFMQTLLKILQRELLTFERPAEAPASAG